MAKKKSIPEPTYDKKRAWHLTVYDLQGGPIPTEATRALDNFATLIAEKYGLAIESVIV